MGLKRKLNQFHKQEEKDRVLEDPRLREVYEKLQRFYKLHPTSTPQVAMEVKKIRDEAESFAKALDEKFQAQHAELMVEFMQKELDYVESYLSPNQKEVLDESVIGEDKQPGPENKDSFIKKIFSW